jgi:acyl homoserine lactone synthase
LFRNNAESRGGSITFGLQLQKERAMLKLIEGSYASFFPKEMDAMFRNRAETFSHRLGWEVTVKDGYERDHFDDENPLYLVSVDPDTEEYWGSLRLLPTTGPNMLHDVFPQLLDGDYIESATIWECSRICATAARGQPGKKRRRRQLRPE